ncbi:MAG: thioredoxin family protein [Candidatus Odinarchaeota archaeon]
MVRKESIMLPLGTPAPDFNLKNAIDGKMISLSDFKHNKALLVMFICNHCPYVIHVRDQFKPLAEEYLPKGVGIIAINSNSIETHPQDGPENMKKLADEMGWSNFFPFLFDETQEVAKAYKAACTPDLYVFDKDQKLMYRGQLDGARPGNKVEVTGKDLRKALDLALDGKIIPEGEQIPSAGCNIKWHPGKEPDYFK